MLGDDVQHFVFFFDDRAPPLFGSQLHQFIDPHQFLVVLVLVEPPLDDLLESISHRLVVFPQQFETRNVFGFLLRYLDGLLVEKIQLTYGFALVGIFDWVDIFDDIQLVGRHLIHL